MIKAVLDTNVFVAASFNKSSSSSKILTESDAGNIKILWNQNTLDETKHILNKIPPIRWESIKNYFTKDGEYTKDTNPEMFEMVEDEDDKKFIALAHAADGNLITNDDHLLSVREKYDVEIYTPSEFIDKYQL